MSANVVSYPLMHLKRTLYNMQFLLSFLSHTLIGTDILIIFMEIIFEL